MAEIERRYRGAVIFLHGSGGNGSNQKAWIDEVNPLFLQTMSRLKIKVIFPWAPSRPYSMMGGEELPVWHDRWSFGLDAKEDTIGVDETCDTIKEIMQQLNQEDGIDDPNIVIGGFSMGGGVSLCTALTMGKRIAGVFSMSSWVSTRSRLWSELDRIKSLSSQDFPPVLLIHGERDGMINPDWGEATYESLRARGLSVQWLLEKNIDHEPGKQGLSLLTSWIEELFENVAD